MNRIVTSVAAALLLTTGGVAMAATSGITMSTDPVKIAAIEQHAQQLQARDHQAKSVKTGATHGAKKTTTHHKQPKHHAAATPKK